MADEVRRPSENELSDEELEQEGAARLPAREALSIVDPSAMSRPPSMDGGDGGVGASGAGGGNPKMPQPA